MPSEQVTFVLRTMARIEPRSGSGNYHPFAFAGVIRKAVIGHDAVMVELHRAWGRIRIPGETPVLFLSRMGSGVPMWFPRKLFLRLVVVSVLVVGRCSTFWEREWGLGVLLAMFIQFPHQHFTPLPSSPLAGLAGYTHTHTHQHLHSS